MREILFRGKRLNGDGWVYGDLSYHVHDGEVYVFPEDGYDSPDCYEVDPSTIGQYTGLTDKNGVKIFEGDIVRYIYEPGEGFWNANQLSVIVWEYTGFMLDGIIGTNKFALLQGWLVSVPCDKNFFEVIGNIHDNQELLKETGNAPTN